VARIDSSAGSRSRGGNRFKIFGDSEPPAAVIAKRPTSDSSSTSNVTPVKMIDKITVLLSRHAPSCLALGLNFAPGSSASRPDHQTISEGVLLSGAMFDSFPEPKRPAGKRLPAPVLVHEIMPYCSSPSRAASLLFIIQHELLSLSLSLPLSLSLFLCDARIRAQVPLGQKSSGLLAFLLAPPPSPKILPDYITYP